MYMHADTHPTIWNKNEIPPVHRNMIKDPAGRLSKSNSAFGSAPGTMSSPYSGALSSWATA